MTDAPSLEDRVAAIEGALAALGSPVVNLHFGETEWTPGQIAEFETAFKQGIAAGARPQLIPAAPLLNPVTARALLAECVTVVKPGETLVIRVPDTWTPRQAEEYQRYADAATAQGRISFPVVVVIGEELGVAQS